MAEYMVTSDQVPELRTALAAYYGTPAADHASVIVPTDLHPAAQKALGLTPGANLSTEDLANLLAGKQADGTDVDRKGEPNNTYFDFTFTAPKSFSVAWALAPDRERELLEGCYRDAVASLMKLIASEVGTASVGRTAGNMATNREPAHIAMLRVEHTTARPTVQVADGDDTKTVEVLVAGDPNRHTHILVPNVAVTDDGRVTAIHQNALEDQVKVWGAIGQAYLMTNLRERLGVDCGLETSPSLDPEQQMGRLFAIPRSVSDLFSKRRNKGRDAAIDLAKAQGLDFDSLSSSEKQSLLDAGVGRTRLQKEKDLREIDTWREHAAKSGFSYRSVLRPDDVGPMAAREDRLTKGYEIAQKLLEEPFEKRAVIEGVMARIVAARSLIQVGTKDGTNDVNAITAAMRSYGIQQDGSKTEIHWAIDPKAKYARLTTQRWADVEGETIALFSQAARDRGVALTPEAVAIAVKQVEAEAAARGEKLDFSQGHGALQRELAEHIAASGRVSAVVGVAGSGKSTLLRIPVRAWKNDGRDLYGISLGWRQTEGLKDAGVNPHQVNQQKRVVDKQGLQDAGISADRIFAVEPFLLRAEKGRLDLSRNSVVAIDEIALIGTKDVLRLARLQAQYGFQIAGIGDDMQGQPIAAGATIDLMRRCLGPDGVPALEATIRQEKDRDKETSLMFRRGDAEGALRRKDEDGTLRIVSGGYHEAINAAADLYFDRLAANEGKRNYTIGISVPTNADGRAISEQIRHRRKAMGEIGSDLCEIDATDQNGERYKMRLAVGDSVRIFDRVWGLREDNGRNTLVGNNGSVLEVAGVTRDYLAVRMASGSVARVNWSKLHPNGDTIRLTWGDAISIDARQSETLKEAITVMPGGSAAVNGFKAYVAESRHRLISWMVTSQGAEKLELQQRWPLGDKRNDETGPATIRNWIIENMGRNLSRQPTKTLATDFLERAQNLRSGTVAALEKAWFKLQTHSKPDKKPTKTNLVQTAAEVQAPQQTAAPPQGLEAEAPKPAPRPAVRPKPEKPRMSEAEIQAAFAAELDKIGLRLPGAPIMDGKKRQAFVDGQKGHYSGDKPVGRASGWYRGHLDGRLSVAGNSRTSQIVRWGPDKDVRSLSPEERRRLQQDADQARRQAKEQQQQKEAATSAEAERIWRAAKPADPKHPYLAAKGIQPGILRQAEKGETARMTDKRVNIGGRLIVPMRDADGKLWNVQMISASGSKVFLPGRKKGLFTVIGKDDPSRPLVFTEGYATGDTLHNTTALRTIVAFDSGNLKPVIEAVHAKHPDRQKIVAADNDHHLPGVTLNLQSDKDGKLAVSWPAGATGKAKDGNTVEYRIAGAPGWTVARMGTQDAGLTISHLLADARYEVRVFSTSNKGPLENVGVLKAADAAKSVGGKVVVPPFAISDSGTDWNDFEKRHGRSKTVAELASQGVPIADPSNASPQQLTPAQRQAHAPAPSQQPRPELRQ